MDSLWSGLHLVLARKLVFDLALYFLVVIYCHYCLLFGCHILPLLFEVSHVDRVVVCGVLSCNITCLHYLVISTTLVRGSIDVTAVTFCIQLSLAFDGSEGLWPLKSLALDMMRLLKSMALDMTRLVLASHVRKHKSSPLSGQMLNK